MVDIAGLSFRALEESTSVTRSDSGESAFYSKSQWGRWLNGQSLPPRKAVKKLVEKLAKEDIEAEHLVDLWDRAFVPTSDPQGPGELSGSVPPTTCAFLTRPRPLPTQRHRLAYRTSFQRRSAALLAGIANCRS